MRSRSRTIIDVESEMLETKYVLEDLIKALRWTCSVAARLHAMGDCRHVKELHSVMEALLKLLWKKWRHYWQLVDEWEKLRGGEQLFH